MTISAENINKMSLAISCLAAFALTFHLLARDSFRDPFHVDIILCVGHLVLFIMPAIFISLGIFEKYWHNQTHAASGHLGEVVFAILLAQGLFNVPFCVFKPHTKQLTSSNYALLEKTIVVFLAVCVWLSRICLLATGSYFHLVRSAFKDHSLLYSPLALTSTFGRIVLIFAAIHVLKSKSFYKSKIPFLYLFSELVWHMFSGKREGFLLAVLSVMLVYSFIHKKVTIRQILSFLLILVVFSSFTHYYRRSVRAQSKSRDISLLKAYKDGAKEIKRKGITEVSAVIFERLNPIKYTAGCMALFPDKRPFLNGSTYTNILWAPFPRLLFPNKPRAEYEYNKIIQPRIKGTTASLTAVGEAYANFGWLGILVVFFCSGIIYRFFDSQIFMSISVSPLLASIWIFLFTILTSISIKPAFSGFSWIFKIFIIILLYRIACRIYEYYISKSQKI